MTDMTVTLAGTTYTLRPAHDRLALVEAGTGKTIFALVEEGRHSGLSINDMAMVVAALADAPDTDPLLGLAKRGMGAHMSFIRAGHADIRRAIVEAGLMIASPAILLPLAMALGGKTDADGKFREAETA